MAATTRIEWTEQTWNPTTGCTKVSPGCKHCYAETLAKRLCAMGAPGYENGFELSLMENRLKQPLSRRKPTLYFVNSMSDLFHEAVPEAFLQKIFTVIEQTPHHTYQILTKRAEHMRLFFHNTLSRIMYGWACRWRTADMACRVWIFSGRLTPGCVSSRPNRCLRIWEGSISPACIG